MHLRQHKATLLLSQCIPRGDAKAGKELRSYGEAAVTFMALAVVARAMKVVPDLVCTCGSSIGQRAVSGKAVQRERCD